MANEKIYEKQEIWNRIFNPTYTSINVTGYIPNLEECLQATIMGLPVLNDNGYYEFVDKVGKRTGPIQRGKMYQGTIGDDNYVLFDNPEGKLNGYTVEFDCIYGNWGAFGATDAVGHRFDVYPYNGGFRIFYVEDSTHSQNRVYGSGIAIGDYVHVKVTWDATDDVEPVVEFDGVPQVGGAASGVTLSSSNDNYYFFNIGAGAFPATTYTGDSGMANVKLFNPDGDLVHFWQCAEGAGTTCLDSVNCVTDELVINSYACSNYSGVGATVTEPETGIHRISDTLGSGDWRSKFMETAVTYSYPGEMYRATFSLRSSEATLTDVYVRSKFSSSANIIKSDFPITDEWVEYEIDFIAISGSLDWCVGCNGWHGIQTNQWIESKLVSVKKLYTGENGVITNATLATFHDENDYMVNNQNLIGYSKGYLEYDGSTSTTNAGTCPLNEASATSFTITGRVNADRVAMNGAIGVIVTNAPGVDPASGGFWLCYSDRNGTNDPIEGLAWNLKTANGYQRGKSSDNVIVGTNDHFAFVFDGVTQQVILYVNGVEDTNRTTDQDGAYTQTTEDMYFGNDDTNTFEYVGSMNGNYNIYTRVLSAAEVLADKNYESVSTTGLIRSFNPSLSTSTLLVDSVGGNNAVMTDVSLGEVPISLDADGESTGVDIYGNTPTYEGLVKRNIKIVENSCLSFDGIDNNIVLDKAISIDTEQDFSITIRIKPSANDDMLLGYSAISSFFCTISNVGTMKISSGSDLQFDDVGINLAEWNTLKFYRDGTNIVALNETTGISQSLPNTMSTKILVLDLIGKRSSGLNYDGFMDYIIIKTDNKTYTYNFGEGSGVTVYDRTPTAYGDDTIYDFSSSISGWTGTNCSISIDSDAMKVVCDNANAPRIVNGGEVDVNKTYRTTYRAKSDTITSIPQIYNGSDYINPIGNTAMSSEYQDFVFILKGLDGFVFRLDDGNLNGQIAYVESLKYSEVFEPINGTLTNSPTWTTDEKATPDNLIEGFSNGLVCGTDGTAYKENTQAYGTLEFSMYKGAGANSITYRIITNSFDAYPDYNGYTLSILNDESLRLAMVTGASVSILFKTDTSYILNNTWYDFKITRSVTGEFTVYIKGGIFGEDYVLVDVSGGSGTNPVTDNTYTTSNYLVADLDAGDQISNLRTDYGMIDLHSFYNGTGVYNKLYLPAQTGNTGLDVLEQTLTNPAGKWHNNAESTLEEYQQPALFITDVSDLGPLLNTADCENGVSYPYDSFTDVTPYSFKAVSDGSTACACGTEDEISIVSGTNYHVKYDLKLNSGVLPKTLLTEAISGAALSGTVTAVEGANDYILTATGTNTGVLQIWNANGDATDFEVTNLRVQEVDGGTPAKYLYGEEKFASPYLEDESDWDLYNPSSATYNWEGGVLTIDGSQTSTLFWRQSIITLDVMGKMVAIIEKTGGTGGVNDWFALDFAGGMVNKFFGEGLQVVEAIGSDGTYTDARMSFGTAWEGKVYFMSYKNVADQTPSKIAYRAIDYDKWELSPRHKFFADAETLKKKNFLVYEEEQTGDDLTKIYKFTKDKVLRDENGDPLTDGDGNILYME